MQPYDFGRLIGATTQQEKEAVLSSIAAGLQNAGRGLMRSGNAQLVSNSPVGGAISRGGMRNFATNMTQEALKDPTLMLGIGSAGRQFAAPLYRGVVQGSLKRNVGRVMTGAGMALNNFIR